jgi:RecA/RadA recombinase
MVERLTLDPTPEDIKETIMAKSECEFSKRVEFLPCGCSNLSLISSGRINDGGLPRQRVINIVGDGSSGKTLCALEFMAAIFYHYTKGLLIQSTLFRATKRLVLIYNNVEGVMDFNVESMYGCKFYDSIEWIRSSTVEDFGYDFFSRIKPYHYKSNPKGFKKGDTIIYIIDSWDALDSKEDLEKFEKKINKIAKGGKLNKEEDKGSYELGKQKYASKRFFKKLCNDVEKADVDVTLLIVSQVRQKIGVTFGETRYRAGGDAMNFYTHLVIWLAEKAKLKKTTLGHERVYGIDVRARVKRSKVWKPFRDIDFKIIFDYGIDDIQSMMDWYFGPKKNPITWLDESYDREDLIDLFHRDPEQLEMLKIAVQEIWDDVESRVTPKRRKYENVTD